MFLTHSARLTAALSVIGIVAGTARLDRRGDAGVARVIGELRAIHSAQETFASACGAGGYASSIEALRVPPLGASAGFISPGVDSDAVGYVLSVDTQDSPVERVSCSGVPVVSSYFAHAEPRPGEDRPSFAIDQKGFVYTRQDGRAIARDFEGAQRLQQGR
jgi:hypothetical protein